MTDSEKLDLLLDKVNNMEDKFDRMEDKVDKIENKVSKIEKEVDEMKEDINDIKLTIENEIRVNIKRIAEGHLDLSRNLHETMKPNNEIEMLVIRVNMLETDVKELKSKYLN